MAQQQLQMQRWELKYIVPEATALAIRRFCSSYLELDDHGKDDPRLSYPIHSLYLDSDVLSLYWHTINGNKNRYKLRLRFYDNKPGSAVFFEIKRRMNDAILKQRGGVRREAADALLEGQLPRPEHLLSKNPKELVALQQFCQFMKEYRAKPKAHIFYMREAWISPHDNSLRVTMDRDVFISAEHTSRLIQEMDRPTNVFGKEVILELKFTGRFPNWLGELVRVFGLTRTTAAKYADGIALVGEQRFLGKHTFTEWAEPEPEPVDDNRYDPFNSNDPNTTTPQPTES